MQLVEHEAKAGSVHWLAAGLRLGFGAVTAGILGREHLARSPPRFSGPDDAHSFQIIDKPGCTGIAYAQLAL